MFTKHQGILAVWLYREECRIKISQSQKQASQAMLPADGIWEWFQCEAKT